MIQTRDTFQAIADPTRRQIIGTLAQKSLNVNAIAQEFDITRQAVSLHVQYLNELRSYCDQKARHGKILRS